MISVIPTHSKNFRAFGWVQDPSNLRSLCDVVAVFDTNSKKHKDLIKTIIPLLSIPSIFAATVSYQANTIYTLMHKY